MNNLKIQDIKITSRKFRVLVSNLMKTDNENYQRNLERILVYINKTPIIKDFIESNIDTDIDFSFLDIGNESTQKMEVPLNEREEISYIYQLLSYIAKEELDVRNLKDGELSSNDKPQKFNRNVASLLFEHINLHLEGLILESSVNQKEDSITNNINVGAYGQINQAFNESAITTSQTYNQSDILKLKKVSSKFVEELTDSADVDSATKELIKELLDATTESIAKNKPKKGIFNILLNHVEDINSAVDSSSSLYKYGKKLISLLGKVIF